MKTAILQLVISTPASPDATPESVARNLRGNAATAGSRANALEALAAKGWTMRQPTVMPDGVSPTPEDDYFDVVIYLDKSFEDSDAAEAEARECGAGVETNWSIGWNADGTVNELGHPNCEWWGEA